MRGWVGVWSDCGTLGIHMAAGETAIANDDISDNRKSNAGVLTAVNCTRYEKHVSIMYRQLYPCDAFLDVLRLTVGPSTTSTAAAVNIIRNATVWPTWEVFVQLHLSSVLFLL